MRASSLALVVVSFLATADLSAHRRDEYLQAARIAIAPGRVELQLDLTPGIAVADSIVADIDRDGDGLFSAKETAAYVERVVSGIGLDVDGRALQVHVTSANFPSASFPAAGAFKNGEGVIQLELEAALPTLTAGAHHLTYRNAHRPDIGVYLANALLPDTDRVAINAQRRDPEQRELTIDYDLREASSRRGWLLASFGVGGVLAAFVLRRVERRLVLEDLARAHHERHAT
jgi:hypothetical protein